MEKGEAQEMNKLPLLTAAAGLVTVFGVAEAKADCQACIPDPDGMRCWSGNNEGIGACVDRWEKTGDGHDIPGTRYCYFTECSNPGGPWYTYTYSDWYYSNYGYYWYGSYYYGDYCYGWCPAE
jgi:hypothetical protein